MKKTIVMVLALAVVVSGIMFRTDAAKAETASTTTGSAVSDETPAPEPTATPSQMKIKVKEKGERYAKVYSSGKTVSVTKGFTLSLSLKASNNKNPQVDIKWISSNSSIATVTAEGVVKGEKIGTAVITAKYSGQASYIKIKVTKNEYTTKPHVSTLFNGAGDLVTGKSGFTSAYFDKKGNIIVEYYQKMKLTKAGKKYRKIDPGWFKSYYHHCYTTSCNITGCPLAIKNNRGRIVAKTRKKILMIMDTKNKVRIMKYKIDKENIKMKQTDIDLRNCKIYLHDVENYI